MKTPASTTPCSTLQRLLQWRSQRQLSQTFQIHRYSSSIIDITNGKEFGSLINTAPHLAYRLNAQQS